MSNNIISILDQISLLYKRADSIKQVSDQLDKKPKPDTSKNIPVIDIYQFELKGYPASAYNQTKFGTLTDSEDKECGLINAKNNNFSEKRSSCDIIKSNLVSQDGGDSKFVKIYSMKEFHDFYKKWKAKGTVDDSYNIKDKHINIITKLFTVSIWMIKYIKINMDENNKKKFDFDTKYDEIKKANNDGKAKNDQQLLQKAQDLILNLGKLIHNDAFVFNITLKPEEKVVVFGDFHGSFHTFMRHIFRLYRAGVINDLDSLRIADGWRIIFLGDILDRGEYAFEILLIIMELMIVNNNEKELKVILNRGNHEEMGTNFRYGFLDEVESKFKNTKSEGLETYLYKLINYGVFSFMSSAIILKSGDKKFWLSHGGIPVGKDETVPTMNFKDNNIMYFNNDDDKYFGNTISFQIRWNDFFNQENVTSSSGRALNVSPAYAHKFMEHNNIDFIIRAHQDSVANSYLVSTIPGSPNAFHLDVQDKVTGIRENKIYINKDTTQLQNIKDGRNVVGGPIARVQLDGLSWSNKGENLKDDINIFPILTLSTNTDQERPLTHDSFGVIRFDLDESQIKMFNKETNIIDPRKDMINRSVTKYLQK